MMNWKDYILPNDQTGKTELTCWLVQVIRLNYYSKTSPLFTKYRKFLSKADELNVINDDEDDWSDYD